MLGRFETHAHSHFSNIRLIDAITKPKDLILTAHQLGYKGITLTDHEALCGHIEWLELEKSLKEKGEIPEDFVCGLGNEIYLTKTREPSQKYFHFILIAKNTLGHRALRELSSTAWINSYWHRGMERVPTLEKELEAIVKKYPNTLIGTNACFTSGAPVLTRNGIKSIETINSNDYILNQYGDWEKVNFPTSRFYEGEGREISFFEGVDSIKCTNNHQFLVTTNNWQHTKTPLRWVEAKDLNQKKGASKHICVFPITPTYSKKNIICRQEWEGSLRKINYTPKYVLPDKIVLTPEIMRLFGLWLGDGSISITDCEKKITLTFSEEEFPFYWSDFVKKASQDLKITWSKKIRKEEHKVELESSSIELVELFYYLFGLSHAEDKYVPKRLKNISPELDWNLFFGYALADGYFRKRKMGKYQLGECVCTSISKQLILDIKELLQSLGIRSSFSTAPAHQGEDGTNHKEAYYLSSSNNAWGLFSKKDFNTDEKVTALLKTAQNHDLKKHFIYNGVLYKKVYIKEIQPIQLEEEVYCLNVDSHSFCCNNVVVHNCLGSRFDGLVLQLVEAEEKNNTQEIIEIKTQINEEITFYKKLFGEDFYLEIAPGTSKDQKRFNKRVKPIAQFYNLKMIIATDAHFLTAKDREIHKSFLNSKDGEREVDSFYFDAHLMDDEEAYENLKEFYTREEFLEMCHNSIEIMNKIEGYDLFHNSIIPEVPLTKVEKTIYNKVKEYPTLSRLQNSDNLQEQKWFQSCLKSLYEKELDKKEYFERLELEASIISHIGEVLGNCLFAYFNTFQHYIDLFWDCGTVIGPGRGSAGSFLSNYLLGITQLDPIEWNFPYFRFLNEDRVELPDIDVDLGPSKRPLILQKMREERGELKVVQIATFGTATSKEAIACGCRGYRSKDCLQGIDVDRAQYMSNLIPIERGNSWNLIDCLEGNEKENRKPIKELVNLFNQYPRLKEICLGIEGVVCQRSQHASGVILYNNSPFETNAIMRSPNGNLTTQFDLHRSERAGDVKFDFLVTDICDKISICLDLLKENGYFRECETKREIYNKYLHPQKLNLKDKRIWEALSNGSVLDVFQFNTDIGIQTAKSIQPRNPVEMTAANGLMRLVAPEGQERPLDRYIKFKNNLDLWYKEMDDFGLTKEEQKIIEPYYLESYGVPHDQERLMLFVMDKNISHFTLAEANATRKILAKKDIKKIPEIKEKFINQCPSKKLAEYCWNTMMLPQLSYSFSMVHSTLYSFIGIQTLILAITYPSVFWNCACLIVNSQSIQDEEPRENDEEIVDTEEDDEEEKETKKKKQKAIDYGRIASAIGQMKTAGIMITAPDINKSTFTFSPDVDSNIIRYGMSGITKVGEDVVKQILANRPYSSIEDFLSKVKLNKTQMINLIKAGVFDSLYTKSREEIMRDYVYSISEPKTTLNLRNLGKLIEFNLLPPAFDFNKKVFNYNKYLKSLQSGTTFKLDSIAFEFYERNFDVDVLTSSDSESGFEISCAQWKKIYDKQMLAPKEYIKKEQKELLEKFNKILFDEIWNKYCAGSVSKWEMDSVSYYSHEHELARVKQSIYDCEDFFKLDSDPDIERIILIKGKQVPLFKIHRIMGTVLDRDKTKKTISLLTTTGVVSVKIFGEVFAHYDKRISAIGADGKKHVTEESFFKRGQKIIVTGIRRGDQFFGKKYKGTPYHLCELITDISDDGYLKTKGVRDEE